MSIQNSFTAFWMKHPSRIVRSLHNTPEYLLCFWTTSLADMEKSSCIRLHTSRQIVLFKSALTCIKKKKLASNQLIQMISYELSIIIF